MRINYQRLVHYIFHHHIGIILVATLLSVFAGFFAAKLARNIKSDFADLLPDDYVSVRELNRIRARVGGIGPLMIVITGDDLEKCIDFMLVLADSLEGNPLVNSVSRNNKTAFLSRNRLLYMDREDLETIYARLDDYIKLQKEKQSPLYFALDDEEEEELDFSDIEQKYSSKYDKYAGDKNSTGYEQDYYLTEEKNGVILRLYPAGVITDVEFSQQLIESIDNTIASINPQSFHPSIEYEYQGSFRNSASQVKIIIDDLKSTASYSLIGVILLISFYFRQVLASIFVALPLLMGLAGTFAVTYLVIGSLNMITVGLFAILFGLGIDFGIHIFARYREARRRGMDIEHALTETIVHTGSALTTTAVTTSVAFYSLLVTDFRGFSEFGFIVGTGILFSLATMLLVCPAFIVLSERLHLLRLQEKAVPRHLLRKGRYPLPRLTLILGLLATAYSIYHIQQLEFEYDFSKLKPKRVNAAKKGSLPENLKEGRSPAIVLTESRAEAQEVVETVEKIKTSRGASSAVRSVYSVYSWLPEEQPPKLEIIDRIRNLLDDSQGLMDREQQAQVDSLREFLQVSEITMKDLPADITNKFTSKDGEILNFVAINSSLPLKDGRNAIRFAEEIREIQTPSGKIYYASSSHVIIAEMLKVMLDDSVVAVVLTLLVVTLVLLIDLRNIAHTLLVLTPLLTALIWVTGFMYVFDIKLNLYNMIAFPTIIGMGIDNGVHVFHRYREGGKGSLRLVLRTTGIALLATSLTTMVGFAGLVPAHHPALTSIGVLSLIGLGCCFITSVTLLPALLQIREQKKS
ncbi:MAG: MMPL family transporter [Gemmatimonadetes bacterium]|jgi:uncharacterized protein|nr:MMPL family transporter [Gemmatimonadota bacterium]